MKTKNVGSSQTGSYGLFIRMFFRDLRKDFTMFVAMSILCLIGVSLCTGLLSVSVRLQSTLDRYFMENSLADAWVRSAVPINRAQFDNIRTLPGTKKCQARMSVEAEMDNDKDVKIQLEIPLYGDSVNVPTVIRGRAINGSASRECLIEDKFAAARGIKVGDTIDIRINGGKVSLKAVGTVMSPDYIYTMKNGIQDSLHYGYAILSENALSDTECNTVLITTDNDADNADLFSRIREILPSAYITGRLVNPGLSAILPLPEIFRDVALVCPLLMYLVAMLIVITSLRRLINNHQTHIGILKALGYTETRIIRYYLMFALIPTFIGCLLGFIAGIILCSRLFLPLMLSSYTLPDIVRAPLPVYGYLIGILPLPVAILVCVISLHRVSGQWGARLLNPRSIAVGRKVLLERVSPLWRTLSFNAKMVVRNIFRNKSRSAISLIGTLCCNMLIIVAFGCYCSFPRSGQQHYGGTMKYDYLINLPADTAASPSSISNRIPAGCIVSEMNMYLPVVYGDKAASWPLSVLEDGQTLIDFGYLESKQISLPDDGVLISKKTAEEMGCGPGDTLTVFITGRKEPLRLKIGAAADMNRDCGIYVSETAWKKYNAMPFQPNRVLVKNLDTEAFNRLHLSEKYEADGSISIREQYDQDQEFYGSLNLLYAVMVIVGLALTFVVSWNTGILNYIERKKEFATMKVLGYRPGEIRSVIAWEGMILAAVGVLISLIPARFLLSFVMKAAEQGKIAVPPYISPFYLCLSCVISLSFSLFIQLLIARKTNNTNMLDCLSMKG